MPAIAIATSIVTQSGGAAITVTVDAIVALGQAIPYSITGTTSASDGSTADVTVNGEIWGSDTVSGGAWSVDGTPTAAMVGDDVMVEATVGSASGTTTTDVVAGTAYWGGDVGVVDIGGVIDSWTDQIGGVVATGHGPTTDGSKTSFDSSSSQYLTIDSDVSDETSHTMIFVVNPIVGKQIHVIDFQAGRLTAYINVVPHHIRYYDDGPHGSYPAESGDQVITYELDSTSGEGMIRLNGSTVESGLSYTPRTLKGGVRMIGCTYFLANFFNGDMYALWIASAAAPPLTAAQIAELETQLANHHLGGMPT